MSSSNNNNSNLIDDSLPYDQGNQKQSSIQVQKYVPPRIDPDLYQAEVPDLVDFEITSNNQGSNPAYKPTDQNGASISDFLIFSRNLLEPLRPNGQDFWSEESVQIHPLESDAKVLEYLAACKFDSSQASQSLLGLLGSGYEGNHTRRACYALEKYSTPLIFTESKEKFLKYGKTAFGDFHSTEESLNVLSDVNPKDQVDSFSHNIYKLGFGKNYSSIRFPRSVDSGELVSDDVQQITFDKSQTQQNSKAGKDDDKNEKANQNSNGSGRSVRSNQPFNEKKEIRKQWLSILSRANEILHGISPTATKYSKGSHSDREKEKKQSNNRHSLSDVQSVIDEALSIPSVISSGGVNQDESLGLENIRQALGELVKAAFNAKNWAATVRDTLLRFSSSVIVKDSQINTIQGLRKILAEGESLLLLVPEETLLRTSIALIESCANVASRIMIGAFQKKYITATSPERIKVYRNRQEEVTIREILHGSNWLINELLIGNENEIKEQLDLNELKHFKLIEESIKTHLIKQISSSTSNDSISSQLATENANQNESISWSTYLDNYNKKEFPRCTLTEVEVLIQQARLYNLKVPEMDFIVLFHRFAFKYHDVADSIVDRSEVFKQSKLVKSLSTKKKYSFENVLALLHISQSFPIIIDGWHELGELISSCHTWKAEVDALAGAVNKPDNHKHNTRVEKSKPVPLKKVELLLSEGEKLPFEFKDELEMLREKKAQAKVWLDRLKKSFNNKVNRSQRRGNTGEEDTADPPAKLSLHDMKMMISEGEEIYKPLASEEDVSNRTISNRELSKAQNVVESAEDWLSRVRSVLQAGTVSDNASDNGTESDADGDNSIKMGSINDTIIFLRNLLAEADTMPVCMEEAQVLRCHLNALEWAKKVRPLIPSSVLDAVKRGETGSDIFVSAACNSENSLSAPTKEKARIQKIRLNDLTLHFKEINKIRSILSEDEKQNFPIKPLIEETAVQTILESAEGWLNRLKRMMQGTSIKKGAKLEVLQLMFVEGSKLPVRFENELKSIKVSIDAASQWLLRYEKELKAMNMMLDPIPSVQTENEMMDVDNNSVSYGHDNSRIHDVKDLTVMMTGNDADSKVSLAQLRKMAEEASTELIVEFDSMKAVIKSIQSIDEWLASVRSICARSEKSNSRATGPYGSISNGSTNMNTGSAKVPLTPFREVENLLNAQFEVELNEDREKLKMVQSKCFNYSREIYDYLSNQFNVDVEYLLGACKDAGTSTVSLCQFGLQFLSGLESKSRPSVFDSTLLKVQSNIQKMMQKVENELAIEVSGYDTLVLYEQLLKWVIASSELVCHQHVQNDYFPLAVRNSSIINFKENVWWGDFDPRYVQHLINDIARVADKAIGKALLNEITHENDQLFSAINTKSGTIGNGMSQYDNTLLLENEKEGMDVASEMTGDEITNPRKRKAVMEDELKPVKVHAGQYKKKIKEAIDGKSPSQLDAKDGSNGDSLLDTISSDVINDEMAPVVKKTRGSQGITKKKVMDDDFSTLVKLANGRAQTWDVDAGSSDNTGKANNSNVNNDSKLDAKPHAGRFQKRKAVVLSNENEKDSETVVEVPPSQVMNNKSNKKQNNIIVYPSINIQPFIRMRQADSPLQPSTGLLKIVDFWTRCLRLYLERLVELEAWLKPANSLLESRARSVVSSNRFNDGIQIENLIKTAKDMRYLCRERVELEKIILSSVAWSDKANRILNYESRSDLLTLDNLKDFMKEGESTVFDYSHLIDSLKGEFKAAKLWVTKINKYNNDPGSTSSAELKELMDQAEEICVDLSEHTESIQLLTKRYCLCRQLYHGAMVGCDTCDDWYHLHCIGLSTAQADKCDKYICIRCTIQMSLKNNVVFVANICNKWMDPDNHFKIREYAAQKITKRINKEEKEVQKVKASITSLLSTVLTQTPSSNLSELHVVEGSGNSDIAILAANEANANSNHLNNPNDDNNPASTPLLNSEYQYWANFLQTDNNYNGDAMDSALIANQLASLTAHQRSLLVALHSEFEITRGNLVRAKQEGIALYQQSEAESSLCHEVMQWMNMMQTVIWPATPEQISLSHPLGPNPNNSHNSNEDRRDKAMNYHDIVCHCLHHLQTGLLPIALQYCSENATSMGISNIEDVMAVLDAFKWMSWCNLCLHIMRFPANTITLKKLVEEARNIRTADDKIIKFVSTILNRATTWKQKTRKFIAQSSRKVDIAKLNVLLIEGSCVPVTTRLKEKMKQVFDKHNKPASNASSNMDTVDETNSSLALAMTANNKPNIIPIAGIAQDSSHATYVSKKYSVFENVYNSSDEEAETMSRIRNNHNNHSSGSIHGDGSGSGMVIFCLAGIANHDLAQDVTVGLWPPKLTFSAKPMKMTLNKTSNQPYSNTATTSIHSSTIANNNNNNNSVELSQAVDSSSSLP
eukprot:gene10367-13929_t